MATENYMALTISPPHSIMSPKYLYQQERRYLEKVIRTFSKKYIVYPEIDDQGRLHYHGLFTIHDKIKYFNYGLLKLKQLPRQVTKYSTQNQAYVCIKPSKTVEQRIGWIVYMSKDFYTSRKVLDIVEPIYPCKPRRIRIKHPSQKQSILDYFPAPAPITVMNHTD